MQDGWLSVKANREPWNSGDRRNDLDRSAGDGQTTGLMRILTRYLTAELAKVFLVWLTGLTLLMIIVGVVREAMRTDKVVIAAGPGNPPAVVDQTADVDKAGRDIVAGASFDNNIICTDEKTTIAVDTVADRLVRSMSQNGAYVLKEHELKRLERVIFKEPGPPRKPGVVDPAFIGKNAGGFHTFFRGPGGGELVPGRADWIQFRIWPTYNAKAGSPAKAATRATGWTSLVELEVLGDAEDVI